MSLSETIKPISYIKSHAAEIIRDFAKQPNVITITQNGEAKAILQDIKSYEQTQETLALLKILALGTEDVHQNKVMPEKEVMQHVQQQFEA